MSDPDSRLIRCLRQAQSDLGEASSLTNDLIVALDTRAENDEFVRLLGGLIALQLDLHDRLVEALRIAEDRPRPKRDHRRPGSG